LCDGGVDDEYTPGEEVVDELTKLGVAFTGADAYFYSITRERMKQQALQ
jgi:hypothetical protein